MSSTCYHRPFLLFASGKQVLGAFPCFHCICFPAREVCIQSSSEQGCGAVIFFSSPQTLFFFYPYSLLVSHQGQVCTKTSTGRGRNDCTATEFSRMCWLILLLPAKFLVVVDFLPNYFLVVQTERICNMLPYTASPCSCSKV